MDNNTVVTELINTAMRPLQSLNFTTQSLGSEPWDYVTKTVREKTEVQPKCDKEQRGRSSVV